MVFGEVIEVRRAMECYREVRTGQRRCQVYIELVEALVMNEIIMGETCDAFDSTTAS